MMKKCISIIALSCLFTISGYAQTLPGGVGIGRRASVGINNPYIDAITITNPKGILHLQGKSALNDSIIRNVGFVIPKADTISAVVTPSGEEAVEGTMIFVPRNLSGATDATKFGCVRIKKENVWQECLTDNTSFENLFNYDVYGGLNIRVKKVSAGFNYSLLIGHEDDAVYAGGQNANGKTGLDSSSSTTPTFKMVLAQETRDISAGYQHALAVTKTGRVYAWGDGANYRTGQNSTTDYVFPMEVKNIPLAVGDIIVRVEAGGENSLLLSKNGKVFAFGNNVRGVNGNGLNTGNLTVPTQISFPVGTVIKDIALSTISAAAVTSDGKVYVWGNQQYGRLGNGGNTSSVVSPTQITFPENIKQVALGSSHGLAISEDGKHLYGWGANQGWGVLGTAASVATVPVEVTQYLESGGFDPVTETIVYIAATRFTTASASATGSATTGGSIVITSKNVYAAGSNTLPDRLGLGYFPKTTTAYYSPTAASGYRGTVATGFHPIYDKTIFPGTFFNQASMGVNHSLLKQTLVIEYNGGGMVKESGSYGYGMGSVNYNQLGAVSTGFTQFPIPSFIKR